MASYPVVEHRESRVGRWVHERRFRLTLFIGLVETVLVLANGLGWFWILATAIVAVAFHIAIGRQSRYHAVREVSWIAATSQLIAFLIPLLWELVKFLAIIILALLALAFLAILLLDRRL